MLKNVGRMKKVKAFCTNAHRVLTLSPVLGVLTILIPRALGDRRGGVLEASGICVLIP